MGRRVSIPPQFGHWTSEHWLQKVHAKEQIPPDFKDQPADGPERKAYVEGLDTLIKQIDDTIGLLDAGKLDEAKAALDGMTQTKREYHKKLKV